MFKALVCILAVSTAVLALPAREQRQLRFTQQQQQRPVTLVQVRQQTPQAHLHQVHHQAHQTHQLHQAPVHVQEVAQAQPVAPAVEEQSSARILPVQSFSAVGTPLVARPLVKIASYDVDVHPEGSFRNVWSSENGIQVQEHATVRDVGGVLVPVVQGEYTYVDNDNNQFKVQYVADENGFQPSGAHLPTPPPIPEAILKAIEYNRINAPKTIESQAAGSFLGRNK